MSYLRSGRIAAERWLGPGRTAPRRPGGRSGRWSAYLLAALVLPVGLYGVIGQHIPGGAVLAAIGLACLAVWWVMRPRYTAAQAQRIGTLASLLTIAFTAAAELALVLILGSPASGVPTASARGAAIAGEAAIVLLVLRLLASYWLRLPAQAAAAVRGTVNAAAAEAAVPGVGFPADVAAAPGVLAAPPVMRAPEVVTAPEFVREPQVVRAPTAVTAAGVMPPAELMPPAETVAGPRVGPAPWVAAAARAVAAARAAAMAEDGARAAAAPPIPLPVPPPIPRPAPRPAPPAGPAPVAWFREHQILVGALVGLLMVVLVVGLVAAVVVLSMSGVSSS
jgi:hypothetical protein